MEAETLKTNFLLTYKDSDLGTMVLGTSELQAESQGSLYTLWHLELLLLLVAGCVFVERVRV